MNYRQVFLDNFPRLISGEIDSFTIGQDWDTISQVRNAATAVRGQIKLQGQSERFAVREDTLDMTIVIYAREKRGAVFGPAGASTALETTPIAVDETRGASVSPELLAAEWMYRHYSDLTPLPTRLALQGNRPTFKLLADGGHFTPAFSALGFELINNLEQMEAKRALDAQPKKVWDVILGLLTEGRTPPLSLLADLAKVQHLLPPETRVELEKHGIQLG